MTRRTSFETDIAQEFRDVKQAIADSNAGVNERISALTQEISSQNRLFERELTKLNSNMEQVLKQIADHEIRLTQLEQKNLMSETRFKTVGELSKFGWFVARLLFGAGAVAGAFLGTAKAWQLVFPAQ